MERSASKKLVKIAHSPLQYFAYPQLDLTMHYAAVCLDEKVSDRPESYFGPQNRLIESRLIHLLQELLTA